jgi:hypothetical protein
VRFVNIILDGCDADKYSFGLKLRITEEYMPAGHDLSTDLQPSAFRPNAVQFAGETEFIVFLFSEVFHSLTEHIPGRTGFCCIVRYIRLRHPYIEYGVFIAHLRHEYTSGHDLPVEFSRHDLKASFSVNIARQICIGLL